MHLYRVIISMQNIEYKILVRYGRCIKIFAVEDQEFINKIYGHLHKGELEVIIGAKEQNIEVVIIGEKSARKFAKDLGLKPIGILGILKLAKLEGKIYKLKPFLDMLIERKFRISDSLYVKLRK